MRVAAISDIHGFLDNPRNMPEGDVLCICGDIVPLEFQIDIVRSISWFCLEFVPWIESLPYKKVLLIAGNHDFFLEEIGKSSHGEYVRQRLLPGRLALKCPKLVYLCDDLVTVDGKKFYGTPWIADLSGWAFYLPESELVKKWEKIPDCDVILTHMPPKVGNVGKVLQLGKYCSDQDFGSESLAETLKTRKFQYVLSGHIHSGAHYPVSLGVGKAVNVSIKNEDYNIFYYPLEVDI